MNIKPCSGFLFFTSLLCGLILGGACRSEAAQALSLDQAVALSLSCNQDLRIAEEKVRASELSRSRDRADYLPTLLAGAGMDVARNARSTPSDKTYRTLSASLSSTLNLFKGFEDQASLRKSEYALHAERDTRARTRQSVIFDTVTAYLETLSRRERIAVAEQNLADHLKQLEQIEAFCTAGRRPLTDLYQQQAQAADARLGLVNAVEAYRVKRLELTEIIGLPLSTEIDVTDRMDALGPLDLPDTPEPLIRQALEKRPDLFALKNKIWSADMAVTEARSGYFPTVNMTAELGSSWSSLDEADASDQWGDDNLTARVGVNVSLPLFDRRVTQTNVAQAGVSNRITRLEYEKLVRRIGVQIGQAFAEYQAALSRVEVTEHQMTYAAKALESTRLRYTSGAATLTELSGAQTVYTEARYNTVDAGLNRVIQALSLAFYRGDLDETFQMKEGTP
ncbi:TolC family protein [Desulfatiferula olefinivorans]